MFEVKNISMIYDMNTDEKLYALNGFDLKLPDKGLVGIIGPSGSGKSTLMYCLSSLKKPTEGEVIYNGKDISSISNKEREMLRRNEFGFVFQKHYLVPYMSALDNILVAGNGSGKEETEKAKDALRLGRPVFVPEKEILDSPGCAALAARGARSFTTPGQSRMIMGIRPDPVKSETILTMAFC